MYAELRCKTNFTFLTGASHPDELIDRAAELGIQALAITDKNGVYGIPKAYWRLKTHPQLKLICGADLVLQDHPNITLLASDRAAYGLMCRILTKAHAEKEKGSAFLKLSELTEFANEAAFRGLFCLPEQPAMPDLPGPAHPNIALLKELFLDKLYLPISRHKDGLDSKRYTQAQIISERYTLPVVATNDVLYHVRERRPLQDTLTSIREGVALHEAGFKLLRNGERYLKSPFEMKQLFRDLPDAIQNTLKIADACTFSPAELKYRYPSEWIPKPHSAQSYLEELTIQGAKDRYKGIIPADVDAQLKHELLLIQKINYADYFLTIYDIVDFARKQNILCQGRGSAANSAVCYCLGITAIDPVRMKLLFERFISLERNEPPDIDVDFEHERREEVIQYIYNKYGRDRAAMVSAIVTYQKRSTLREVSKAFGIHVGTLSAKKVVREFDELVKGSPIPDCKAQIEKLSDEMATFPRHISIHSGGFTLSADPITEIVPVEPASMPGRTIIQWDKYDLDYLGLLKIDVLALGMLSALRKTLDQVGIKLHEIPSEDHDTYKMIQKANTVGTFQVESRAQMNMSGRLMPRTFYDLVVQVAIVRPGPIVGQMVHPYLKRRNGIEKVIYPHPKLREILGRTLGVPLFQEQLMKIAIELGEFTPGEADHLRRAIGAWRASGSIQTVAEKLLKGFQKNKIPNDYALNILEHMKGFAHYGFPESHAASFALLTYASCYLKCHYPAEFTCGLINSQPMGFYAVHTLLDDAKRHGVTVYPVDPNLSQWDSTIENKGIRLGLNVVQGLHKTDAEQIIQQRPFSSLADFLSKTSISKDILSRLAMGNAFQNFGQDQRHSLWQILGGLYQNQTLAPSSHDLFASMNAFEAVQSDYNSFGLSTQGHPMQALRKQKNLPKITTFEAKRSPPKKFIKTAGLLLIRQKPPTANGVCFAAIEDEHGFLDLVLFAQDYERNKEVFLNHCFLIVSGYIERDGHSVSMIVKKVEPIWKEAQGNLVIEPDQYFW